MNITTVHNISIIEMPPRFDDSNAPQVEMALATLLKGGAHRVICDFSSCCYISSAGLSVLLSSNKKPKKEGGELEVFRIRFLVFPVLHE